MRPQSSKSSIPASFLASGEFGVSTVARGINVRLKDSISISLARLVPPPAARIGSKTTGTPGADSSSSCTACTSSTLPRRPILMTAGGISRSTVSACFRNASALCGKTSRTLRVSCTVSAVMTDEGNSESADGFDVGLNAGSAGGIVSRQAQHDGRRGFHLGVQAGFRSGQFPTSGGARLDFAQSRSRFRHVPVPGLGSGGLSLKSCVEVRYFLSSALFSSKISMFYLPVSGRCTFFARAEIARFFIHYNSSESEPRRSNGGRTHLVHHQTGCRS